MHYNQTYLPASQVRTRYGVSDMSLWRWLRDDALGFPHPIRDELISSTATRLQASSFVTAIPWGEWWRVKVVSASGDVQLFGMFEARLTALIAAVLMAEHVGARVVP